MIAHEILTGGDGNFLDTHVRLIRSVYRERRDAMLSAMEAFFPESVRWTTPHGGLFLWVTLPEGLKKSIKAVYDNEWHLMALPERTRLFHCHDYKAAGRDTFAWETTVGAQRAGNVHVHEGVGEEEFVAMRDARDATLSMPKLILPSIQVNMRGGHLPEPESNGTRYLKIPLDVL